MEGMFHPISKFVLLSNSFSRFKNFVKYSIDNFSYISFSLLSAIADLSSGKFGFEEFLHL